MCSAFGYKGTLNEWCEEDRSSLVDEPWHAGVFQIVDEGSGGFGGLFFSEARRTRGLVTSSGKSLTSSPKDR
jgi:hypothetical protein